MHGMVKHSTLFEKGLAVMYCMCTDMVFSKCAKTTSTSFNRRLHTVHGKHPLAFAELLLGSPFDLPYHTYQSYWMRTMQLTVKCDIQGVSILFSLSNKWFK